MEFISSFFSTPLWHFFDNPLCKNQKIRFIRSTRENIKKRHRNIEKKIRSLASGNVLTQGFFSPERKGKKNRNGLPIQDINLGMIARLKEQAGIHSGLVARVLDAVAATIHVDEDDLEIYTSGATNFFKYPELSDKTKATELISTFEEKQQLVDLVKERMADDNTGVQVYIGDELPISTMKDCSVVTATYELGEGMHGTIGIVGPKRMDYENVVNSLKTLKVELDEVFKKNKSNQDS